MIVFQATCGSGSGSNREKIVSGEVICEEIAHRAGFIVSVGNWIAPDGTLIVGKDHEKHHYDTLLEHCECNEDNRIRWMNDKVQEGYIRLVFRADVFFQVGCETLDDLWGNEPNIEKMISILKNLTGIDIHIFSKTFYVIGLAEYIVNKQTDKLEIRQK